MSRDVKWFEHVLHYTLSPEQLQHLISPSYEHQIHQTPSWEYSSDDDPNKPPFPPCPIIPHSSCTSFDITSPSSSSSQPPTPINHPQIVRKSTEQLNLPPSSTTMSPLSLT